MGRTSIGAVLAFAASILLPSSAAAGPRNAATGKAAEETSATQSVETVTEWIARRGDSGGLPYIVVDKRAARIAAYDGSGRLMGIAPALLGSAIGDLSAPGIGTMKLSQITPEMRTTPAGRFDAALGKDLGTEDVLWVDYDAAISLHRVVTTKPAERRLQRLASATPDDNRISYGCINIPAQFYDEVVRPLFLPGNGVVYILPETAGFGSLTDLMERKGR
jgi:hypothetical protein